jgi:hypothetical protein
MLEALMGKPKKVKKVTKVDLGKRGSFKIRKGLLHKHLGIAPGTKIPFARLKEALKSKDSAIRHEAASAIGLEAMSRKK